MKIVMMGAGGLGGYIGGQLVRAGNDVTFVARGRQLEALARDGLDVRGGSGSFRIPSVKVTDAPATTTGADLIMLAVKSYQLVGAMQAMAPLVGPQTAILPFLNGIEHMQILNDRFGADRVLGGISNMTAHVTAPGVVERIGTHGNIELGEQAGGTSQRIERIAQVLAIDGLGARISPAITVAMWQKLTTICALGLFSVARLDKQGILRGMPETGQLMRQIASEVVRVAQAMAVDLPDAAVDRFMQQFESLPPRFKPSMLVGVERGQPIEVEALNGVIVRFGREHGVPTPVNDFVYACLKPIAGGASG